jgi:hypothetical protein
MGVFAVSHCLFTALRFRVVYSFYFIPYSRQIYCQHVSGLDIAYPLPALRFWYWRYDF